MEFDTKLAVVLLDELPTWQKVNATAFLVSGFAAAETSLVGEPYVDGTGNRYLPMFRQPLLVYAADSAGIRRAYERAMARGVEELAIFTRASSSPRRTTSRTVRRSLRSRRTSSTSSGSHCARSARRSTRCSTGCARTRRRGRSREQLYVSGQLI